MKRLFTSVILLASAAAFGQGSNGLVAHWNFNGSANDVSGHSLNGVTTATSNSVGYNGLANNSFKFNGTSSSIEVAYNNMLNLDSFSICALVRIDGFYSGDCQVNSILSRGTQETGDFYALGFQDNLYDQDCSIYSPTQDRFAPGTHGPSPVPLSQYTAQPALTANTWYCVTTTYHSDDTIKMYLDGVQILKYYWPTSLSNSSMGLNIGSTLLDGGTTFPYYFNGLIDDIRLYKRALTAAEVMTFCDSAKQVWLDVPEIGTDLYITVAPNPATNVVSIASHRNATDDMHLSIYDITGRTVGTYVTSNKKIDIDIAHLPKGLYMIKVQQGAMVETQKLLKE